jgi:hypothetical protein
MEAMASIDRLPADTTVLEEADVLRRFIEAIESGELMDTAPQDAVVVRRLQGALTALESVDAGSGGDSRSDC